MLFAHADVYPTYTDFHKQEISSVLVSPDGVGVGPHDEYDLKCLYIPPQGRHSKAMCTVTAKAKRTMDNGDKSKEIEGKINAWFREPRNGACM